MKGYKRHKHEDREDLAGEYRWGDTGQLVLLVAFVIGLLADVFLLKISSPWQEIVPWYFRVVVFLPIVFIAGYFSQKAHKKIFQEKREKLTVINTDVFAMVRHPMYLGSILTFLGFVVLSFSVVAFVIFVVIAVFYYYLGRYEERLLLANLGDEYQKYMNEVPMLIPRIRRG